MSKELINVLTRIAVALEKLAGDPLSQPNKTPYPWDKVSIRTRVQMQKAVSNQIEKGSFQYRGMQWPLSCEDLQKLGAHAIVENRNVTDTDLNDIRKHMPEPFVIE